MSAVSDWAQPGCAQDWTFWGLPGTFRAFPSFSGPLAAGGVPALSQSRPVLHDSDCPPPTSKDPFGDASHPETPLQGHMLSCG